MMQNLHKKHSGVIVKHCIVQILRAKINLPSEQLTKIHKTTIKLL